MGFRPLGHLLMRRSFSTWPSVRLCRGLQVLIEEYARDNKSEPRCELLTPGGGRIDFVDFLPMGPFAVLVEQKPVPGQKTKTFLVEEEDDCSFSIG
jgi:hypothetical protein